MRLPHFETMRTKLTLAARRAAMGIRPRLWFQGGGSGGDASRVEGGGPGVGGPGGALPVDLEVPLDLVALAIPNVPPVGPPTNRRSP